MIKHTQDGKIYEVESYFLERVARERLRNALEELKEWTKELTAEESSEDGE